MVDPTWPDEVLEPMAADLERDEVQAYGRSWFTRQERIVLLRAWFLGTKFFDTLGNDNEAIERKLEDNFNKFFGTMRLYRLHDSILLSLLYGKYVCQGFNEHDEPVLMPTPAPPRR